MARKRKVIKEEIEDQIPENVIPKIFRVQFLDGKSNMSEILLSADYYTYEDDGSLNLCDEQGEKVASFKNWIMVEKFNVRLQKIESLLEESLMPEIEEEQN